MILPAASMLTQFAPAGPSLIRWTSEYTALSGVVIAAASAVDPPAYAVLTGIVVAQADNEAAELTGIVQGLSTAQLNIINNDQRNAGAQGSPVKHEHITYP